jgi:hypothetical protein
MWREDQIEQFTYLIRSREKKRCWLMNNYKFEDTCDLTMARWRMATRMMAKTTAMTMTTGGPLPLAVIS